MMFSLWFHPVLAVNGDAQTLIDLLITVIFIVIWLAGSLIRANTNKPSSQRRRRRDTNAKSFGPDPSSTKTRSTFASPSFLARWEEMAHRIEAEAEQQRLKQAPLSGVENETPKAAKETAKEEPVITYEQRRTLDQTMEISLDTPSARISSPHERESLKSMGHIDGLTQSRLTGVGGSLLDMDTAHLDFQLDIHLPSQWDRDQLAQSIVTLEIISEPVALRDPQARFMV